MVNKCVVSGCRSGHRKKNEIVSKVCKFTGRKVTFHKFPLKNETLCAAWLAVIGRLKFAPSKYSKICSLHFVDSDFIENSIDINASRRRKKINCNESLKLQRRYLMANAVPSVFQSTNGVVQPRKTTKASPAVKSKMEEPILDNVEEIFNTKDDVFPLTFGCQAKVKVEEPVLANVKDTFDTKDDEFSSMLEHYSRELKPEKECSLDGDDVDDTDETSSDASEDMSALTPERLSNELKSETGKTTKYSLHLDGAEETADTDNGVSALTLEKLSEELKSATSKPSGYSLYVDECVIAICWMMINPDSIPDIVSSMTIKADLTYVLSVKGKPVPVTQIPKSIRGPIRTISQMIDLMTIVKTLGESITEEA